MNRIAALLSRLVAAQPTVRLADALRAGRAS